MKDFAFVFRTDYGQMPAGTPEQALAMTRRWMDWIGQIAKENKLTDRGNRLYDTGRVVKSNEVVTNGPYTEIKESIGGYTIVKADSYEDAVEMAKTCPILFVGGNVEIREINAL